MRLLISSNTYSSWKTVPNLTRRETWDGWTGRCECTLHRAPIQALCVSICQQTAFGVNSETDNDRFSILLQLQRQPRAHAQTCSMRSMPGSSQSLPAISSTCAAKWWCHSMASSFHTASNSWSKFPGPDPSLCGKIKNEDASFMRAICLTTWWCDWVGPLLSK